VARLWQSLIVVFIVTTISFFLIRAAPGDPFSYEGTGISPEIRERWRQQFGYDRPLIEQYVRYLGSAARGQFGYSVRWHSSVSTVLAWAVPRTLLLVGVALALSLVIGVIIGVLQAVHRDGWFDRLSSGVLLTLYSLPDFWGALMAMLIFAFWWPILPASGIVDPLTHDYMTPWAATVDRLQHLILPVGSLTLMIMAGITRFQRAAMLEILPADYVRTARANGLPERRVIWRHALRTALTPIITLLGVMFPALLGGALFVEKVFQWPGMGFVAASAISTRDYDVVTATVVIGSVMVALGNVVADLLHAAIDPRVRE
ncbi:MAG TPA: ABC transporter permease, partial [Gemmatimonadaceae bacterium]|nr:ABC transporter permease [Gemmatimonadaceae bacterium]